MKSKLLIFFFTLFLLFSCNKTSKDKYPLVVSSEVGIYSINSCYELEIQNSKKIPKKIKNLVSKYFRKRIGKGNFQKLNFSHGYINSNKPYLNFKNEIDELIYITKEKDCDTEYIDTMYNYPTYNLIYSLKLEKIGIEKLELNIAIDSNGKIIKGIEYPAKPFLMDNLIPIDSINQLLIERKISPKKLEVEFIYDDQQKSFFWTTRTIISNGSILGSSCIPSYKRHFDIDAISGKIKEFE
jgi:hypothetical protein